ncbi:hypothetical protein CONPUDRAFT_163830 [Coniophora puteana RWD-64-598 SS2]|uniref:Rhodopsin domain-containing protein n=1 Tax=Coniophora puteana (strain RWD-64-598) TaxID=741705 RepID=A0A5M3MVY4_CONPW|nr:uncharacterized protein CONPUDRAFT_163830 [Coniophora puteana RWD-64-598 SS2]EIW82751.1 hypothetical protein CONPUDRAFT_163830 [Coniophora puteana RWD-64-598 SS2]
MSTHTPDEYQGATPPRISIVYLCLQTGLYAFALALTAFRLWIRRGRYWWEDILALVAGVFCVLCNVSLWLMYFPDVGGLPPMTQVFVLASVADGRPVINRAFQWLAMVTFANAVWLARTSILVSIMRVSTSPRFSLIIHASLVLFVLLWAVEFSSKMWLCGRNLTYACQTSLVYEDIIISLDVASTFILVALPLFMLWNVKLARMPKTLILLVFGVGVVNAAASYVHAVFLAPQTPLTGITGNIQCAVDLIVCNLLVTVTFGYRVLRTRRRRNKNRSTTTDTGDITTSTDDISGLGAATRYTNNVVEGRYVLTTVELELDSAGFDHHSGSERGRESGLGYGIERSADS